MNLRSSLPRWGLLAGCVLAAGWSSAFTLGDIRSVSRQGERLHAEVDINGQGDAGIEAGCVHFSKPAIDDGTPWLSQGGLSVRREGGKTLLDVRSADFIRDPVLRIGLTVGCGHGLQREYTLLFAAASAMSDLPSTPSDSLRKHKGSTSLPAASRRTAERVSRDSDVALQAPPRRMERHALQPGSGDRAPLSGIDEGGDPGLRLATDLQSGQSLDGRDDTRELLRMEYAVLQALHERAKTQLDASERFRQAESSLGNLQQRTGDLASRPEQPPVAIPVVATVAAPIAIPAPSTKPKTSVVVEWGPYGGAIVGLLAMWWLVRRRNSRRRIDAELARFSPPREIAEPLPEFDDFDAAPQRVSAAPQKKGVSAGTNPLPVLTVEVPAATTGATQPVPLAKPPFAGATVDEHYEVNPVMELADIMLSFGRVKGAAQALQEFIDHNPEEALQPWIRLLDVYRMAGMRSEFERVAADLNQHFNVEIQIWNDADVDQSSLEEPAALAEPLPIQWPNGARKARSIEEMEHVLVRLAELWPSQECAVYLNQLLRDNRGGLRTGLSLPVVGELLFLIDLQQTVASLETAGGLAA